jgi:hypothetical protein
MPERSSLTSLGQWPNLIKNYRSTWYLGSCTPAIKNHPCQITWPPTWPFSSILVGSYGNSILYAVELIAVIQYHSTSKAKHDSFLLRGMVYSMFLLDTASTLSTCATVYLVCGKTITFVTPGADAICCRVRSLIGVWRFSPLLKR